MSIYLSHHGVLGMKWGIRRYQPYPKGKSGTYLGQRKEYVNKGIKQKREISKNIFRRYLTESEAKSKNDIEYDKDIVKKKGETVSHISGIDIEKLKSGQLYVSSNLYDDALYSAFLGGRLKSKGFEPKKVELTLSTDLKAPSPKKQLGFFSEMTSSNRIQIINDLGEYYLNKQKVSSLDEGKKLAASKNNGDLYLDFVNSLERPSNSQRMFYDILKEKGYNAVLDEHDRLGSWMQAKSPLIIMDVVNQTSGMKVSDLSVRDMRRSLEKWMGLNN